MRMRQRAPRIGRMRLGREKFIACLSSDGLQTMIVAQNEMIGQRSGADEHFRPGQVLHGCDERVRSLFHQHPSSFSRIHFSLLSGTDR